MQAVVEMGEEDKFQPSEKSPLPRRSSDTIPGIPFSLHFGDQSKLENWENPKRESLLCSVCWNWWGWRGVWMWIWSYDPYLNYKAKVVVSMSLVNNCSHRFVHYIDALST